MLKRGKGEISKRGTRDAERNVGCGLCKRGGRCHGGAMKFILAAILAGWVGVVARAEEPAMRASKAAVRQEVVAVIEGQLAAFRAGEVGRAYGYAAAGLQMQTPPRRFAQLVRDGYPEIWANTRGEFGLVRDDGARAMLTARIFAKDGTSAAYDYVLVKEDDAWRIAGVLRHDPQNRTGT